MAATKASTVQRVAFIHRLLEALSPLWIKRAQDLAIELGVSERSIYRGLKILRAKGYRIHGSTGRGGGLLLRGSPINKKGGAS